MKKCATILTEQQAIKEARARLREQGARLAFTNGVFDLLHVGHLRYLQQAAELADQLWIGLNGDSSVRLLKGAKRPLISWGERAELMAALRVVDAVVFFDERTADGIIRLVEPDLYIKGGDYTLDRLPEAATVQEVGAEIHFLPFVSGRSTTDIVQTIVERYGQTSP